jgi:hypothetical protein
MWEIQHKTLELTPEQRDQISMGMISENDVADMLKTLMEEECKDRWEPFHVAFPVIFFKREVEVL